MIMNQEQLLQMAKTLEQVAQGLDSLNPEFIEELDKATQKLGFIMSERLFSITDLFNLINNLSPEAIEKIRGPELRD